MRTCVHNVICANACLVDCKPHNRAPLGAQDSLPLGASAGLQGLLVRAHLCAAWLAAPQTDPPGASQAESWASSAPIRTLKEVRDRMRKISRLSGRDASCSHAAICWYSRHLAVRQLLPPVSTTFMKRAQDVKRYLL